MSKPSQYRCRHTVDAMQWHDTDEDREAFATWFEANDRMFETCGPVIHMPDDGSEVYGGEWVVWIDTEFVAMTDEQFTAEYELTTTRDTANRGAE